jgi:hypothetical protein
LTAAGGDLRLSWNSQVVHPPWSHAMRRRGQTLLELIAAVTVLAATVTPALVILRNALEQTRRIETLELLTTLCVSKLEEQLAVACAAWSTGTAAGDFSADGYSQVRFSVASSDQAGDGGIPDRLMSVTATVWEDQNGNAALDAGELSVVLASKVAKMEGYGG